MAEPKQLKAIKGGLNIAKRLLADGENEAEAIAAITAAQRAEAGRKGAALIKSQPPVKASEALGQQMEKGVKRVTTTQADRTRVGGGNIGGAPFSAISEADPNYAGKVWGVMDEGTAARLKNLTDDETVWTTMLGSANQLKTNPVVFDKLKRQFLESMKQGNLSPELEAKINHNLALNFGEGANIRDPKIWRQADTFEKRAALADLMMGQGIPPSKGGVALGGEKSGKGVIFKPTDTLKRETEPSLLHTEHGGDVPTFAAGPRLFKLEKESVYRPDLHPGFPTLLTGKDMNVNMIPTPTEIFLPDWHKAFKEKKPERFQRPWSPEIVQRRKSGSYEVKGEGPGYYDLALGLEGEGLPSQALHDEYIRHLIREGFKKGGAVDIDAADRRLAQAMEKRMSGGGMAKGGKVDIAAADARLEAAIEARMAKGGEVGFKKIQFMNKGGKLVEGVTTIGKKLLASGEEAPKVDRLSMSYKDVTKRVPEVAEAIEKLNRGEITKAQYNDIVKLYKPVTPYSFVPKPATKDEAVGALRGDAAKERYGKQSEYEPGSKVGLRLDIPAYTGKGVWVNSIHNEKAKKVAYGPTASVKNADLSISQAESKRIALGGAKAPYARIKGDWNPMSDEEAIAKAQEYLNHPEWRQIGMDPERHSYFYDRATMQPITNAEEIIQIGPLVLGKNPKFASIDDFEYANGGYATMLPFADGGKIVKGGLNIARRLFKTTDGYTFKEMPDGRVTNGDMTWNSVKEFKQEMPHAYQQGDELGLRRANMESYNRPDPQNIPSDLSKFMPDDAQAQFQRALNKQNAPKPQLSVVPPEKKARGGLMMAGGGRPAGGESIQDTLKNIQNYSVLDQGAPKKPNELGGVVLSGASWLAGDEKTKLAKQAFGQDVTNTAVGGYKTADVLNQLNVFERDGGTFAPGTTVVLDIGANDIATGVDPAITRRNLDEIVSRLGDSGVQIIMSAQPFANTFQEAIDNPNLVMNEMYSDIASNNPHVTLVDAMSGFLNQKDLMDESGFHLNSDDAKLAYINKFADAYKTNNPTTQVETGIPEQIAQITQTGNLVNTPQQVEQVTQTGTSVDIPQEIAQITQVDKPVERYTPEAQVDFMPAVIEREPSAGYSYAQQNQGLDSYYQAINDYLSQQRSQDEIQAAMEQFGVSQADIDSARGSGVGKFDESYATESYADGGSAFKTIQWQKPQKFDGGGIASPEETNPFEGSRREPLLTEKDWANIKRNAPEVYEWAKQNVKDEANQLKSARGVKDFALRTGAQYLGGIPDLANLGLMGVDALANTNLSSEKPWFGSEQYIDAMRKAGMIGEHEFPISETIAGILAPAGLIKKGVKKVGNMRPAKEAPKKRRGGLTAMSR
jgi:acyl-CoA thioesterase-1